MTTVFKPGGVIPPEGGDFGPKYGTGMTLNRIDSETAVKTDTLTGRTGLDHSDHHAE